MKHLLRKKPEPATTHLKLPHLARGMMPGRMITMASLLVILVMILAACSGAPVPVAAPAADTPTTEAAAPAEEATPTEEAAPTEEPAEEEEPTEEPAEEATEEPAEEATAEPTEEPTEEATEEALEEATAEPTEEATEEPTEEATEEATEEPTEEPTAEATEEPEEEALSPEAEAGLYLITIARGCGCHFNGDLGGMAGGAFALHPGGAANSVYPANVTPDEATGIGSWTPEQIATAIRTGATPDENYQLSPVMPYMAFSHLSDEDALNIAAYLLAQEPIENAVPARTLEEEPEPFTPDEEPPATAPTDPVERGEYLVELARCGECHTPRNEDGTPNMDMFLAGNRISEDEVAWNLTPDDATGTGTLSEEEIADFLRTGVLADGSKVAGTMADMIEDYFSKLTEEDAAAIAAFLKSIPAVENDPE